MERDQAIKLMQTLLRTMLERKGSDLFITAGFPPAIKIDGEVRPQTEGPLTPEQSAVLTRAIMNDKQTRDFDATKECQFAIAPPGIGRFRASAFIQQGFTGCVIRTINAKIPTIDDLELPPILKDVSLTKRGLVIVVGGTGSGKTSLLKGLLAQIGTHERIVTVEETAELVVKFDNLAQLLARDPWDIGDLIQIAMRMRPDRIIVGECRAPKEVGGFIEAINTGHAGSITTTHASGVEDGLQRLLTLAAQNESSKSSIENVGRLVANGLDVIVYLGVAYQPNADGELTRMRRVVEIATIDSFLIQHGSPTFVTSPLFGRFIDPQDPSSFTDIGFPLLCAGYGRLTERFKARMRTNGLDMEKFRALLPCETLVDLSGKSYHASK